MSKHPGRKGLPGGHYIAGSITHNGKFSYVMLTPHQREIERIARNYCLLFKKAHNRDCDLSSERIYNMWRMTRDLGGAEQDEEVLHQMFENNPEKGKTTWSTTP